MKHLGKRIGTLVLCLALLAGSTACTEQRNGGYDLMLNVQKNSTQPKQAADFKQGTADFSVRLLQECVQLDGENPLVSPLSVMLALGMCANGAAGQTREQMEQTLGGLKVEDLNASLAAYVEHMPQSEKTQFTFSDGIWLRSGALKPNPDFLQTNADYYRAELREADFSNETVQEINNWVKKNTHGMIEKIIDELDPQAVMCLLNALTFEGKWVNPYNEYSVHDYAFKNADGKAVTVDMMESEEHTYLQDEHAIGFMKPYDGEKYAFVALLPEEGMTVQAYIAALSGEKWLNLLQNAESRKVITGLPKFTLDYSATLNDVLQNMGMTDAFTPDRADFTAMGECAQPVYVGSVLHKTHIEVAEDGTKAAAVTAVFMEAMGAMPVEEPPRVILDRPFVYAIVDCEQNLPLFIGAVTQMEGNA